MPLLGGIAKSDNVYTTIPTAELTRQQDFYPESVSADETMDEKAVIAPTNILSLREKWLNILISSRTLIGLLCLLVILDIALKNSCFAERCSRKLTVPSPLSRTATLPPRTVFFNGPLAPGASPWRQGPDAEVDAMWESIIHEGLIVISDDKVRKLGKEPWQFRRVPAELLPKYGDGILAGTEFGHHLHCLNMIRKFTYFDHYGQVSSEFDFYNVSMKLVRTHIDHCIDIIRQVLMCRPDEGLYLSYWIDGRVGPMADFNTMHKCRDFDAMMGWAKDHEIKEALSEYPVDGEMVWTRQHHP